MARQKPDGIVRLMVAGVLKLTERDITRQVCDFMWAHGWRGIRMQSGLMGRPSGGAFRVGEPGMPDWLFVRYVHPEHATGWVAAQCAEVLWVEVKAPGKWLSSAQVAWHERERMRGGIVAVVDDIDVYRDWYAREVGL